jgi:hypothetical protein
LLLLLLLYEKMLLLLVLLLQGMQLLEMLMRGHIHLLLRLHEVLRLRLLLLM